MATIKGGDKLRAYLQSMKSKLVDKGNLTLRVGFLSKATYPDGKPVAMIAAIQEYGAPRAGIPPRPFFRNMIAAHENEWPKGFATQLKETNYDIEATFERAGQAIAGQLRQSIVDTNDPPLSQITLMIRKMKSEGATITKASLAVAAKRLAAGESVSGISTKPLVETGHLLNSVDHEVVSK